MFWLNRTPGISYVPYIQLRSLIREFISRYSKKGDFEGGKRMTRRLFQGFCDSI